MFPLPAGYHDRVRGCQLRSLPERLIVMCALCVHLIDDFCNFSFRNANPIDTIITLDRRRRRYSQVWGRTRHGGVILGPLSSRREPIPLVFLVNNY